MSKTIAYLIAAAALIALGRVAAPPPEPARAPSGDQAHAVAAPNPGQPMGVAVPVPSPRH